MGVDEDESIARSQEALIVAVACLVSETKPAVRPFFKSNNFPLNLV
jgi:hypothetical protein